jgi:hypothetical protein
MVKGAERTLRTGTVRLLSLEVCPQRFGFAVFDGPVTLLDWGVRNYRGRHAHRQAALRRRILVLLRLYAPATLVMRQRDCASIRAHKKTLLAVDMIGADANRHGLKVHSMKGTEVLHFFSKFSCVTKHQIASRIAHWFAELSPKLPSARKSWQSEKHNMAVFDAVATGITFFSRDRSSRPRPPRKQTS